MALHLPDNYHLNWVYDPDETNFAVNLVYESHRLATGSYSNFSSYEYIFEYQKMFRSLRIKKLVYDAIPACGPNGSHRTWYEQNNSIHRVKK